MLNGAVVETGHRVISTNLPVDSNEFPFAIGARDFMKKDVRLSTAVLLSSRFPYVTPAGRISGPVPERKGETIELRVVDGGYYENSGAATIRDLLASIGDLLVKEVRQHGKTWRLVPIFVQFTNDPILSDPPEVKPASAGELLSPPRALFKTREAHGYSETLRLDKLVRTRYCGYYFHIRTRQYQTHLPLGWYMTRSAREEMQQQLSAGPLDEEQKAFERVLNNPPYRLRIARNIDIPTVDQLLAQHQMNALINLIRKPRLPQQICRSIPR